MGIFRDKTKEDILQEILEFGAEQTEKKKVKVVDFTYQSDDLAEMIVKAWTDEDFYKDLTVGSWTDRGNRTKKALADRGIFLSKAQVITEEEYNKGHNCADPDEIIFVLPNKNRQAGSEGEDLLETAKLLMAITPNGI
ncbi:MAG TPA: hypothetical protein VFL53_13595 [Pseudolabrys sp.]|nr:hypothetical protein [Pseudolabrys sp.]